MKTAQKSFLLTSEGGKTAGSSRQRKCLFRLLSQGKRFRSKAIAEMGDISRSLLQGHLVELLEHAPGRVASVVLQGATGFPEPLAPVAAHTLWLLGDAGLTGQMRPRLAALHNAVVHWIKDYPEFLWSDTAVHHTEELANTMLRFLKRMDAEGALPPVSVSSTCEVAGVTYFAAGSGTPVVLLPLGLASGQWEPVLPRLQAHHCTIVLGGKYLQPVELLEATAEGGYARMALHLDSRRSRRSNCEKGAALQLPSIAIA